MERNGNVMLMKQTNKLLAVSAAEPEPQAKASNSMMQITTMICPEGMVNNEGGVDNTGPPPFAPFCEFIINFSRFLRFAPLIVCQRGS